MEPLPTSQELKEAQEACKKAWAKSWTASGDEKLKLVHKAFPYAVSGGGSKGSLTINLHPTYNAFAISDHGGFLTLVSVSDWAQLLAALALEFKERGAFRELITGQKPARPRTREAPGSKISVTRKPPGSKISLADIGLVPVKGDIA